jgi:hypothetical protein
MYASVSMLACSQPLKQTTPAISYSEDEQAGQQSFDTDKERDG